MLERLKRTFTMLLEDGGPSSTRLINMVVAGTGAWLLYYGARSGEVSWPWAACFMAYLAYGAGPVTLKEWFGVIRAKVGNETQSQTPEASSKTVE